MIISLSAAILNAHLILAAADRVPTFNVEPDCRAASAESIGPSQDVQACLRDENDARDTLVKTWSNFTPADRTSCSNLARLGGAPTYTELLTCLEMARDAKNLPQDIRGLGEGRR
jgi:hypothetical protein